MNKATQWIDENIVAASRGEVRTGLKRAMTAKTAKGQKLEEPIPVTGNYRLLGFTIKELGKTASIMLGYDKATVNVYEEYLALELSDRLKKEFNLETIDVDDYYKITAYGKMVMEELEKLTSKDISFVLSNLYKVFN